MLRLPLRSRQGAAGRGKTDSERLGSFEFGAKSLPRGSLGVKRAWCPRLVPWSVPSDTSKLRDGAVPARRTSSGNPLHPLDGSCILRCRPLSLLHLCFWEDKPNSHISVGQTAPFVSFAEWNFVPVFPGQSALAVQEVWERVWLQFGKMLCCQFLSNWHFLVLKSFSESF